MTKEERDWIDILLMTDSNLYKSSSVQKRASASDKKRVRIMNYLDKLESVHKAASANKGLLIERLYKSFYHRLYVISEDKIPEDYFRGRQQFIRESDIGDSNYFAKQRKELAERAVYDQKRSLDLWLDYFLYDEKGKTYPMYEQYWAFHGILKMGKFKMETGKYTRRNSKTAYPFPNLNKEALENTMEAIENYVKFKTVPEGLESIADAFHTYNFKTLYEYYLKQYYLRHKSDSDDGIWKKYNQGSDYKLLFNDLKDQRTGWCNTDSESSAAEHLAGGDFYAYFTKDENGEYTVPRIAIRMMNNYVSEVRGISIYQNIESSMAPVVSKKLDEFTLDEVTSNRRSDMNRLTLIEKKVNSNIPLEINDLAFLYEIYDRIHEYGEGRDPRIQEIISKRDIKADLSTLFGVPLENISLDEVNDDTLIYYGDLDVKDGDYIPSVVIGNFSLNVPSMDGIKLPKIVTGNFELHGFNTVSELSISTRVVGNVIIPDLVFASLIELPKNNCGDIDLRKLMMCDKILFPSKVKGDILLDNLAKAKDMVFPEVVEHNVGLRLLSSGENLILPRKVGYSLFLNNLNSPDGIEFPESVGGVIYMRNFDANEIVRRMKR